MGQDDDKYLFPGHPQWGKKPEKAKPPLAPAPEDPNPGGWKAATGSRDGSYKWGDVSLRHVVIGGIAAVVAVALFGPPPPMSTPPSGQGDDIENGYYSLYNKDAITQDEQQMQNLARCAAALDVLQKYRALGRTDKVPLWQSITETDCRKAGKSVDP